MLQAQGENSPESPKDIKQIASQLVMKYSEMSSSDPDRFKQAVEELKVKARTGNK